MSIYDRLIENSLFFKWIYHPSEEIESYWENYLKTNPNDAERIIEFKSRFVQYLGYNNKKLTDIEKRALANRIIRQLEKAEKKRKYFFNVRKTMQYAAIAIVFFMIGGSIGYMYFKSRHSVELANYSTLPEQIQDPLLFVDKQAIPLNQGKSELDYTNNDKIIIDKERNIISESNTKVPQINTLVIPYGNRSIITLSDSSTVWLNAGSRLIYPSKFVDKTREVYLVGEALFDVKKNDNQPFIVKTSDVKIAVKGTRFNVSAYSEDYSVQTALIEGSVEVYRINAGLFEKGVNITPGQMAYFNKKSKDTKVINVDVNKYILWTKGLYNFSNTELNRITKQLERYYNIKFKYEDPFYGTIQITGKLDVSQNMSEVLEYLSKLTGLEITEINERQYVIK